MKMVKESVLNYFGGTTATAKFLGIAKSTVSVWPAQIPWKYALLLERLTDGKLKYDPELYQQQASGNTKSA
ncbi:Cro/CI family transcriptional regulator [Yokenella regensburgei]|uniref:Cro/CI family transcriptional regulator n=1 Tax=Yokenella regensburgei TaxID=158877 RepID=UPI003ED9CCE2